MLPKINALVGVIVCGLVMPSTLGGYPVTGIGKKAFYFCSSLTSITIPNSVTEIGNEAFERCESLRTVIVDSESEIPRIKELIEKSNSGLKVEDLEFECAKGKLNELEREK